MIRNDWVRLEIAHALRRSITVIPVLVGGARLPPKNALPEDIQGLLDHQAASVTTTGFRYEMSGLVRDIRFIRSKSHAWVYASIGAGLFLAAVGFAAISVFRIGVNFQGPTTTKDQKEIWASEPGEWVMYAVDLQPIAYYFKPGSVRPFGKDGSSIVYTARFPLKTNSTLSSDKMFSQGVYQDETSIIDCEKGLFFSFERTVYGRSHEVISHFKKAAPKSLDLSNSDPIKAGSIVQMSQHVMCDERLRSPLIVRRIEDLKLSYLANVSNGDGVILYGQPRKLNGSAHMVESLVVFKLASDHDFSELFQGQKILGLPPYGYRAFAETMQIDCITRTMVPPKMDYLDQQDRLIYVFAPITNPPIKVQGGSPLDVLLIAACGRQALDVSGTYEGMNASTYNKGGDGEQKIVLNVEQAGSDVKLSFRTASGGMGEGTGKIVDERIASMTLQSTAPGCSGAYNASIEFSGDNMNWTFKGDDCGGAMEGHGTAKKVR
jgi:hypothetical protein